MGRYKEGRAPQGAPTDGERDVWFDGGEVKFGHYVSASDTWVVDRAIGYIDRVSRLLPEETSPHFHANVYDANRKVAVHEGALKPGFTKGDANGTLLNLMAFVNDGTSSPAAINSADGLQVVIPFAYILKIIPGFAVETDNLAVWDEATEQKVLLSSLDGITVVREAGVGFKVNITSWPTEDPIIFAY